MFHTYFKASKHRYNTPVNVSRRTCDSSLFDRCCYRLWRHKHLNDVKDRYVKMTSPFPVPSSSPSPLLWPAKRQNFILKNVSFFPWENRLLSELYSAGGNSEIMMLYFAPIWRLLVFLLLLCKTVLLFYRVVVNITTLKI